MPVNEVGYNNEPEPQSPRLSRICSMAEELHSAINSVGCRVDSICGGSRDASKSGPVPVPDGLNAQIEQMLEGALARLREIDLRLMAEA